MKTTYLHIIILVLFSFLFTSCITNNLLVDKKTKSSNAVNALDSVFYHKPNYQYTIRKDDKISISVWGQDELSVGSSYGIYNSNEVYGKWLMVDSKGNIEAPRLGTICVEKMSVIELKDSLKSIFSKWIINPVVDIKVLNKEITVLGEVREPQVISVDKEKNSLLDILARCKGFDSYANIKYIKVLRQIGENVYVANIDLSSGDNYLKRNIDLCPGDVIVVPSKKYKEFDKRISIIIPFTSAVTAAAIFLKAF